MILSMQFQLMKLWMWERLNVVCLIHIVGWFLISSLVAVHRLFYELFTTR